MSNDAHVWDGCQKIIRFSVGFRLPGNVFLEVNSSLLLLLLYLFVYIAYMNFGSDDRTLCELLIFSLNTAFWWFASLPLILLIHEAAHLITARLCGIHVKHILICGLGGCVFFRQEEMDKLKRWRQFMIYFSGPAANILLAVVVFLYFRYYFRHFYFMKNSLLGGLVGHSFLIGFLNLLPIYPLDGGRIISLLMDNRIGRKIIIFHAIALGMRIISLTIAFASLYWVRDILSAVIFIGIAIWGPRLLRCELTRPKISEGGEDSGDLVLQDNDKH